MLSPVLDRAQVSERLMRALLVVPSDPSIDGPLRLPEAGERVWQGNSVIARSITPMSYRRMLEDRGARKIGGVCVIRDEEAVARRLRAFADAHMTDLLGTPLAFGETPRDFTAE